MLTKKMSGQAPYVFTSRDDLRSLPQAALPFEVNLHGGFAIDPRSGQGEIFYGMPGCGVMRVSADLQRQEIIGLPDKLQPMNFHSTKIGIFDGGWRLILPANGDEMVVILRLDGQVDFIVPRPIFDEYQSQDAPYRPTDVALVGDRLFIADGYGSNYITSLDVHTQQWAEIWGGKTTDPTENGRFATAHGIGFNPVHHHLDIADRPHSRIQTHATDGQFVASHHLPSGAFLCGISYLEHGGRWIAAIGCLQDPEVGRPAPIYIVDAQSYELLSIVRPKEELGIELAQHLHNVVLHRHADQLYLVCQSWNPGCYFVLQAV